MAENTKINDHNFNPWREKNGTRVVASEAMWREPVKWNKAADIAHEDWKKGVGACEYEMATRPAYQRPRVFCASFADVFEDWAGPMLDAKGEQLFKTGVNGTWWNSTTKYHAETTMNDVRARLFRLIDATPNLDWLLLTKRPENIAAMMPKYRDNNCDHKRASCEEVGCQGGIRQNVWLGVSVENQEQADKRIPHLLKTPAAVRFLSLEPLLGPADLRRGVYAQVPDGRLEGTTLEGIHWTIIGGESGHGARPCDLEWIRSIRDQCKAAGVSCYVKQLGSKPVDASYFAQAAKWFHEQWGFPPTLPGQIAECQFRLSDSKGGDSSE